MPTPIGISGSRAAAVLGLSQYQTPVQVWLEIMGREFCDGHGYEFPVFEGNAATRWGTAFEDALAELTQDRLGVQITDREKFYERDYLTCHVDGIIGDTLYEAKTTGTMSYYESWGEDGGDKIPVNYQLQIQHNMALTGLSRAVVAVLVWPRRVEELEEMGWAVVADDGEVVYLKNSTTGKTAYPSQWARVLAEMGYFHIYNIPANPELQALMHSKYRVFWEGHVLTGTPPEPMNVDDIKALVREPSGTIVCDERIERLMMEYRQITAEIGQGGALAKRKEEIKTAVLTWMRDAEKTIDDDSERKWILRDRAGKKIAAWGIDKSGRMIFR